MSSNELVLFHII